MTALAIEINDAGLVVADDTGVLAVEPGIAYVERGAIRTGREALPHVRVKPRQVSNRFWGALSMEPGSGIEGRNSSAELAFAQLDALWKRFGERASDVLLVVPGNLRGEQLGLLLGLAQECDMPVRALVDAAVAASVQPYPGRQLLYADASSYRASATLIEQGADAAVHAENELPAGGIATVNDAFTRRFAEIFVRVTRLDPFHHSETEQQLYERVPEWLAQLESSSSVECVLRHRDEEFRATVSRDAVLAAVTGFYRAALQLIAQTREPGRSLVVLLSSRLAALPGLVTELARLDDAQIELLPQGQAARGALLAAGEVLAGADAGVKLWKHLKWRAAAAAEPETGASAPVRPVRAAADDDAPTHVVYRGVVYRIDGKGVLIGREANGGRRTIVVDDQSSGVSREHCELVLRDGELRLHDLSRFGTFVNEKRVSGEATLHRSDVIRIGTPGAELQIVSMEPAHAA
jgi:FHA domain-containing protein